MSDSIIRDGDNSGASAAPILAELELQRFAGSTWYRLTLPQGNACCFVPLYSSYQEPLDLTHFPKQAATARRGLIQLRDLGLVAQQLIFSLFLFYASVRQVAVNIYTYDILHNMVLLCLANAMIVLVSVLSFLEIRALRKLIAAKLDVSQLMRALFNGPELVSEILRKTPEPFRFLFSTYRPRNRQRCLDALADNLDWYLRKESVHIRWIWVGYILNIVMFICLMFDITIISVEQMGPNSILTGICFLVILQLNTISIYRRVVCREYLMLYISDHFFSEHPKPSAVPLQ
jgi:hypothetical protein